MILEGSGPRFCRVWGKFFENFTCFWPCIAESLPRLVEISASHGMPTFDCYTSMPFYRWAEIFQGGWGGGSPPQGVSIEYYLKMYVCMYVCMCVCIQIHKKSCQNNYNLSENSQNKTITKISEFVQTLPKASGCILTYRNVSEQVRTGQKTSKNLRKLQISCEKLAKVLVFRYL